MGWVNKGSCFNCGDDVDPDDYDEIGNSRVNVCDKHECSRELRGEQRAEYEDRRHRAEQDGYERYGY